MSANETKNQASGTKPPNHSRPNHRKVIEELLEVVRKQQTIMEHLSRDLAFTRYQFETNLNYDNGDGDYTADTDYETIDLRAQGMDIGNGIISVNTATDYMGYKVAMENYEAGFKKTKDQLEKIWEAVDLVQRDKIFEAVDLAQREDEFVPKSSLTLPDWLADGLEKGRKAAAQE